MTKDQATDLQVTIGDLATKAAWASSYIRADLDMTDCYLRGIIESASKALAQVIIIQATKEESCKA